LLICQCPDFYADIGSNLDSFNIVIFKGEQVVLYSVLKRIYLVL